MVKPIEGVNPAILVWARERSGYSREDVARILKREPQELESWEDGSGAPTYPQLEKLAYRIYKRPLALFFFPEPPLEEDPDHSFRTLPEFEIDALSPDSLFKIRKARALQEFVAELSDRENSAPRLIFRDLAIRPSTVVRSGARRVREYLGIPIETQRGWRSNEVAFKAWRNALEEVGVYVFKDAFQQVEVSGFCLFDSEFPLIYINNGTSFARQSFTLFHELAHILLGTSGITKRDSRYIDSLTGTSKAVEVFCNRFTGEFLVPTGDFLGSLKGRSFDDNLAADLADEYSVSRAVVLRKFLDQGLITEQLYSQKAEEWIEDYKRYRKGSKGGDYYATQATYLGDRYLKQAFGYYHRGKCTLDQLADFLNVKVSSVVGLESYSLQ